MLFEDAHQAFGRFGISDTIRTKLVDLTEINGARSQGSNPWQTQGMALGVSRSSSIFLWTYTNRE